MSKLQMIVDFLKDEEGLTTVEYAIAGSLVGATVVGAFGALGVHRSLCEGDLSQGLQVIGQAIERSCLE